MYENKTKAATASVTVNIDAVDNETRRKDSNVLLNLLEQITGHTPVLWAHGLIGFGSYHYKYDTGREGNMLKAGFSPRKQNLAIYNTGHMRYPK